MSLYDNFSSLHVVLKVRDIIRRRWGLEMFYIDEAGIVQGFAAGERYQAKNVICRTSLSGEHSFKHCIGSLREATEIGRQGKAAKPFIHGCHMGFIITGVPIFFADRYWGSVCVSGVVDSPITAKFRQSVRQQADKKGIRPPNFDKAMESVVVLTHKDFEYIGELLTMAVEEMIAVETELTKRDRQIQQLNNTLRTRFRYDSIIGKSTVMQDIFQLLDKVVETDSTVLIQGESGTGKELIAKAIHYNSLRKSRDFVVANCSAFNDNLLESELFGHVKGSFTGAIRDKKGLFELADGGTFFLDEIGEMTPALQVKVLRVLQEGTFSRVGGVEQRKVNVRFISATHRNLKDMIRDGKFREDLYYRINVITINLPALRDRKEDIPLLVQHFLQKHVGSEKKIRLSERIMQAFYNYPWPGNIRELENEIERLVVLSGGAPQITEEILSPHISSTLGAAATVQVPAALKPGAEAAPAGLPDSIKYKGKLKDAIEAVEKEMILDRLRRTGWNKSKVAKELGISRTNLILKVDKYGIEKMTVN